MDRKKMKEKKKNTSEDELEIREDIENKQKGKIKYKNIEKEIVYRI